jgi:hypothetical protein
MINESKGIKGLMARFYEGWNPHDVESQVYTCLDNFSLFISPVIYYSSIQRDLKQVIILPLPPLYVHPPYTCPVKDQRSGLAGSMS